MSVNSRDGARVRDEEQEGNGGMNVMPAFLLMTLFFAINHGAVTAIIPLATSQFGTDLGNMSLGVLYFFYTITALLGSTTIVSWLGHKWALCLGCVVYSLYVIGMFMGVVTHEGLRWFFVLFGSVFGGIAAGFLWTAQGGYFSNAAKHYSTHKGVELKHATAHLSSVFAGFYLCMELVMKLLSSLVLVWVCESHWTGSFIAGQCGTEGPGPDNKDSDFIKNIKFKGVLWTYGAFSVLVVGSAIGMAFVPAIKAPGIDEAQRLIQESKPVEKKPWHFKVLMVANLIREQPKLVCLGMINVLFGVSAAYANSYVTGTIIKDSLGDNKVGYFVSIIPLVASVAQKPLAYISRVTGTQTIAIVLGNVCFMGFGLTFFLIDVTTGDVTKHAGKWGVLVPLFVVFGIGRAVWEGANKAVVANMFEHNSDAAFAAVILFLGTTSTLAFALYGFLNSQVKELAIIITGVLSIGGYFVALHMHQRQQLRSASEMIANTGVLG
ncbi:UNC93-like protein 3 [Diplonema papillatum]|nr:UNC93-like protein 3 [Diplonema papillatum]|eukprot:gene19212-29583_t